MAGCVVMVPFLTFAFVMVGFFEPIRETNVDSPNGGRVVIQHMRTGIGPDSSCARLDVRASDSATARHRHFSCASQEFDVSATFDTASHLVVALDRDLVCEFEVDWNDLRVEALSDHERCRNFVD